MNNLKRGDLVAWHFAFSGAHRGIVLGENYFGDRYRVRWLTGSGGVGEHYRDDLIKIEGEGAQSKER